jgi:hypothetical protein
VRHRNQNQEQQDECENPDGSWRASSDETLFSGVIPLLPTMKQTMNAPVRWPLHTNNPRANSANMAPCRCGTRGPAEHGVRDVPALQLPIGRRFKAVTINPDLRKTLEWSGACMETQTLPAAWETMSEEPI